MVWTLWKRIGVALFLVALAEGIWTSNVWYQYQATLPRHPDQATGNIYPLNVHGIVVYQTRDQRDRLDRLDYSSFGLGIVAALMLIIHAKKFGVPPSPPKPWSPGPGWRSHLP
jgi:hypothetical protein